MTIPTIKSNTNTDIRTKTTAGSITRANVADIFDALADELLVRGIKAVADTTALSALTGADNKNAIVADNGIFQYAASGTPNGTTIFAANGGGVWVRVFAHQDITGKQDALESGTNLKTVNSTSLLGSGNIDASTDISGKQNTLVSGTNIKTINSMSLLGSGNIDIVTSDEIEEYANLAAFPGTGNTNILYVSLDTDYLYRWSGSAYVQVGGISGGGSSFILDVLTDGSTITWDFDGNPAKVTISASRTLDVNISGSGVNYSTLEVVHTNASTVLTLPGVSSQVTWATGAGETTLLNMYHNGTSFIWYN